MERLSNGRPSKSYIDNSIVCDKCGRSIKSSNVYGFSHPCSGRIREINEHFKKTITFASNQEEVRKAREVRAYANVMYSPKHCVEVAMQSIRKR